MLQKLLKVVTVQPTLSNYFSKFFQANFVKVIEIITFPEKLKYAETSETSICYLTVPRPSFGHY